MERENKNRIIRELEAFYKEKKSFIPVAETAKTKEELDFLLNSPELFFAASKSRLIMMHWLCREIRRVYERVSFVPIDISNEAYEHLRKHFKTKAFNKAELLAVFNVANNTMLSYKDFSAIEDKYIDAYNAVVDNDMKLPKVKHIFVSSLSPCADLKQELENLLTKERVADVLYFRSKGKTLDAIGVEYGITRERSRQIEIKPKALIERWMNERHEELTNILGGKIIADTKKAEAYFGERLWSILKYCAGSRKKQKFSNWYYVKELDTICSSKDFSEDIINIIRKYSEKGKTEAELVAAVQEKYPFLTDKQVSNFYPSAEIYSYSGKLYASKVNIGRGIIAAVSEEFTDGIKISDQKQLKEFADYLNTRFGLHVQPNRALTARIQDILVMSDRATYKAPDSVNPSKQLNKAITDKINSMQDDRTTYQSLFESIPKEVLNACGINTFSALHGYIRTHEKDLGLVALRYYVCKGDTVKLKSKDFFDKFRIWLEEQKRPCKLKEILEVFNGWTEMYPKYAMLYFPQVVQWGNGTYFNLDCLDVSDEGVKQAAAVLEEATRNKLKYTNAYIMYRKLKAQAPLFIKDKLITTESHAYLLLKYKLSDNGEYVFAKPHIVRASALNGKRDFTTEDLIKCVIGKKNVVMKDDIANEVQKYFGGKNSSLCLATQHVLQDFIRIGTKTYYRKTAAKFSKEDIQKIENFIEKNMVDGKFMSPVKCDNFDGLPDAPFEWNSWSVSSCAELYTSKYRLNLNRNNIAHNTMLIVPIDSKYRTREQIAVAMLNEKYSEPQDEAVVIDYLKNIGLCPQLINIEDLKNGGLNFEITNEAG